MIAIPFPPDAEAIRIALCVAKNTAARFPCPPGSAVESDDLFSECYLAAWQALLAFDPSKGRLTAWVIAKCRGAVLEAFRRADPLTRADRTRFREAQKKDPDAQLPVRSLSLTLCETLASPDDALERVADRVDAGRRSATLLANLDDPQERAALWLIGGLSYDPEEAGWRMGISRESASHLYDRARAKLRGEALPSEPWQELFLAAIAEGMSQTKAAAAAGVYRQTPRKRAVRDPEFARAWAQAEQEVKP